MALVGTLSTLVDVVALAGVFVSNVTDVADTTVTSFLVHASTVRGAVVRVLGAFVNI